MPMYEFKCDYCGAIKEYVFRHVDNRDQLETCSNCEEFMRRQITTHKTKPFTPYYHRQLGQNFNSLSEEKAYAKKHGLVNISRDFGKTLLAHQSFQKRK